MKWQIKIDIDTRQYVERNFKKMAAESEAGIVGDQTETLLKISLVINHGVKVDPQNSWRVTLEQEIFSSTFFNFIEQGIQDTKMLLIHFFSYLTSKVRVP